MERDVGVLLFCWHEDYSFASMGSGSVCGSAPPRRMDGWRRLYAGPAA
ncbi:hypothetical protein HMPREF1248_1009 [Coriobacteriaceae bacterium BV3Ac1]|nr:hypothetical protein HMPREF1248_1009 [Coriobacteriaceae bacterium BV3Ac1]